MFPVKTHGFAWKHEKGEANVLFAFSSVVLLSCGDGHIKVGKRRGFLCQRPIAHQTLEMTSSWH
jgi:hypothetical protein